MILKVFSVLDAKVGVFGNPWYEQYEAAAIRNFSDAVVDGSNPNNMWHKHPEDFALYLIGEFNNENGLIKAVQPVCLVTASAVRGPRQEVVN